LPIVDVVFFYAVAAAVIELLDCHIAYFWQVVER
jgi:hypothetical protein